MGTQIWQPPGSAHLGGGEPNRGTGPALLSVEIHKMESVPIMGSLLMNIFINKYTF